MGGYTVLKGIIAATFVSLVALVMCFVLAVSHILVKPFSRKLHLRICFLTLDSILTLFLPTIEASKGLTILYAGDYDQLQEESALLMANHLSYIDWGFFYGFAKRKNRLGAIKFLVKDPIKFFPFFGWGMWLLDWLFLKRSFEKDKVRLEKALASYSYDTTVLKEPLWLVLFPEGTRRNHKKILDAQAFCKKNDLPIMKHALYPRKRGFQLCVQNLRDAVPALYDVTVVYRGFPSKHGGEGIPSITQFLFSKLNDRQVVFHVKRFEMKDLPKSDDELGLWLEQRWVAKDNALQVFESTGQIPPEWGKSEPIKMLPVSTVLKPLACYLGLMYAEFRVLRRLFHPSF